MKFQDVITYEQKMFTSVSDKKIVEGYVYDKNHSILFEALRKGPMTIDEIMEKYREAKNPKSLMTVYRYIRNLTKVGLVVEAGKRVFTDKENRNKTVTLYCRSAKIFYDKTIDSRFWKDQPSIRKKECEVYKLLLESHFEGKQASLDCINDVIQRVYEKGQENMEEIIQQSEKNFHQYLSDFDYMMTNTLIVHIGWISLIMNEDVAKELQKCLTKNLAKE